jgi:hypothetical protein
MKGKMMRRAMARLGKLGQKGLTQRMGRDGRRFTVSPRFKAWPFWQFPDPLQPLPASFFSRPLQPASGGQAFAVFA